MLHKIMNLDKMKASDIIYHYTKCGGAQGIITDKSIRATRSDFLNDTNEICYILTVANEIIDQLENFLWRELLKNNITRPIEQISKNKYYIASFSTEPDSITLWAEFGENTGYNVGFYSEKLIQILENNQRVSHHGKVIYSRQRQLKIVKTLLFDKIPKAIGETFDVIIEEALENNEAERFRKLCRIFQKAINVYALFFKQEEFASEHEYRFAFKEKSNTDIKFREKEGFLVPYIMIDISNGEKKLPISSMTVAPKYHIDLARAGMELYLRHYEYDIAVELSKIKLRY